MIARCEWINILHMKKRKQRKKEEMVNSEDGSMFWTWKTIPSSTLAPCSITHKSPCLLTFFLVVIRSGPWIGIAMDLYILLLRIHVYNISLLVWS